MPNRQRRRLRNDRVGLLCSLCLVLIIGCAGTPSGRGNAQTPDHPAANPLAPTRPQAEAATGPDPAWTGAEAPAEVSLPPVAHTPDPPQPVIPQAVAPDMPISAPQVASRIDPPGIIPAPAAIAAPETTAFTRRQPQPTAVALLAPSTPPAAPRTPATAGSRPEPATQPEPVVDTPPTAQHDPAAALRTAAQLSPAPAANPTPAPVTNPVSEPAAGPEPTPTAPRAPGISESALPAEQLQESFSASSGRSAAEGEISVVLPGRGWVYVGRDHGDRPVEFIRKQRTTTGEEFIFRMSGEGSYRLWFQQQDALTGAVRNERITIEAGGDEGARTVVVDADAEVAARAAPADRTSSREYSLSDTPGAIAVPSRTEPSPPTVPAETPEEAPATADVPTDPLAALSEALDQSDTPGVLRALDSLDIEARSPSPDDLYRAAAILSDPAPQRAVSLLDRYLANPSGMIPADRAHIELARLLEREGPQRNLRDSLYHYNVVRESYPLSIYWDEAERRYQHLRRHFFDVR